MINFHFCYCLTLYERLLLLKSYDSNSYFRYFEGMLSQLNLNWSCCYLHYYYYQYFHYYFAIIHLTYHFIQSILHSTSNSPTQLMLQQLTIIVSSLASIKQFFYQFLDLLIKSHQLFQKCHLALSPFFSLLKFS